MSIVKTSWSGGKDSTASVILHTLNGDKCKIVCFIPMLTPKIPLIHKDHHDFILSTSELFKSWGHDVHIVTGKPYTLVFNSKITRGKNKGKFKGYSLGFGFCTFRNESKISSLRKCDVGDYDYEDIGIAYDEVKRQNQLNDNLRSILVSEKYTEDDCRNLCIRYNLLSPHYARSSRDGCAICPNNKKTDFIEWLNEYPHAKTILKQLDKRYDYLYSKGAVLSDPKGKKITPFWSRKNFTDIINEYSDGKI